MHKIKHLTRDIYLNYINIEFLFHRKRAFSELSRRVVSLFVGKLTVRVLTIISKKKIYFAGKMLRPLCVKDLVLELERKAV
jgi:hypothetical protein